MDYFEALGVPKQLALDLDDLQRRFYARSREWHPDRHARGTAAEREQAETMTAALNDAWRVLREPVARAEYILKSEGFAIGEQRGDDVPPELLEEVFELNMALEEARDGDSGARSQVGAALAKFEAMLADIDFRRDALFSEFDLAGGDREKLVELRALLNRRKYLHNLVRQARQSLE